MWKWWQSGTFRWPKIENHISHSMEFHMFLSCFESEMEKHFHRNSGLEILATCLCYLILQWDGTPQMSVHAFSSHISDFKGDDFSQRKLAPIQSATVRSGIHLKFNLRTSERGNRPTCGPQKQHFAFPFSLQPLTRWLFPFARSYPHWQLERGHKMKQKFS